MLQRSLPLLPLFALAALAAACDDSDVIVGANGIPGPPAVDASGDVSPTAGPEPICLADSDCAALAQGPCVQALCEPQSRRCVVALRPTWAACDDGDPCTSASLCADGVCEGVGATDCDDLNPCTNDVCQSNGGCKHPPKLAGACSDDNPCTLGDHCEAGACVATANACTCQSDADCKPFATDACAGPLQCTLGQCVAQPAGKIDCSDGNPCTIDLCDKATGACSHSGAGDGKPCDDGSVCTLGETCKGVTCQGGAALACSPGQGACPAQCDPIKGCVGSSAQNGTACDDGNVCTAGDACWSGSCVGKPVCGCQSDADCAATQPPACAGVPICLAGKCAVDASKALPCDSTDATACELDVCQAKGCAKVALGPGAACSDGDACTAGDVCGGGACKGAVAVSCDDGDACTADGCAKAGGCSHLPLIDKQPCDDGNPCTKGESCQLGGCLGGGSPCDDGDSCTLDICDPTTSGCKKVNGADGQTCDDGNACTIGGACAGGKCIPTQVLDCDDANPCTTDTCAVNGCAHVAAPGGATVACNDANPCTVGDHCEGALCTGAAGGCECQVDADCAPNEDGNPCNGTLRCVANACVVDPGTIVTCSSSDNPCVAIACNTKLGVCQEVPVPVDATLTACSDGNVCTVGDACVAGGVCAPGKQSVCNDSNACTADTCDAVKGCVYLPFEQSAAAQCDDGNPCTFGDVCAKGACAPGKMVCECQTDLDCAAKDDGNLCDGSLVCKQGACISDGKVVACPPAASVCVMNLCDPKSGACSTFAAPDGLTCSTPGLCTTGGSCKTGACQGATVSGCDDGNPCTKDACGATGCTHAPTIGAPCDDGNACTAGEACDANGVCGGGKGSCSCKVDADCMSFDDGNFCNGVYACQGGACQPKVGSVVVCDKSQDGPCQTNTCATSTGQCALVQQPAGTACSDGDACTQSEACAKGACGGGTKVNCDDSNPCTADGCSPVGGCTHTNTTLACDDGNPCTTNDACAGGACKGSGTCECKVDADCKNDGDLCNGVVKCTAGSCQTDPKTVVTCDPSLATPCTVNACKATSGQCALTPVPDGTQCNDANVCTGKDQCVAGACKGTVASCDDGNVCTTDACSPTAGCTNSANTGPCDDGNPCSSPDACFNGGCAPGPNVCGVCKTDSDCKDDGDLCNGTLVCSAGQCQQKPGSIVVCADGGACATNACDAKTGLCVKTSKPNGTACDDGTVCTASSACAGGACVGANPLSCDDNNQCTLDSCDAKVGCTKTPVAGACDDLNPCTTGDVCSPSGQCVPGVNTCQCLQNADCAKFEDGDLCNGTLICSANQCTIKPGSVVTCPSGGACTVSQCEPKSGACVATTKPNGTPCDDKSVCTTGDACQAGACVGGKLVCDDSNPCTTDGCDAALGCRFTPANGAPCDDGNACTKPDVCQAGKCQGGANTCQCAVQADCAKFEDGDLCNGTLVCSAGQCAVGPGTVVNCPDDGKICTNLLCDKATGKCNSANVADGSACGGAELCGGTGTCKAGACAGAIGCADDGNPCTTAACDGKGLCSQAPNSATCSDGNVCTVGDVCAGGACKPGANQCQCKVDADCAALDNGNLCDGVLICSAGVCVPKPNSVVTCAPTGAPCTQNQCDPKTGVCNKADVANGTPCDDNNACTTGGQCFAGACLVGQLNCNDNNECTNDSCNTSSGCVHTNVPGGFPPKTCNDNNPCTPIDICQNGKCQGPFNNCFCQNDSQCQDDNNLCNGKPFCQGGTCKPGTPVKCDPSKDTACIANTCVNATGVCVPTPKPPGTACNDGNTCTGGDVCSGGTCIGVPAACDDGVACTLDSCDSKVGCVHVGSSTACNDGNPCTVDSCDLIAGCLTTPALGQPCDDGNACTAGDVCGVVAAKPACTGPNPVVCNDSNPCTSDGCDAKAGCAFKPADGQPCNDNNLCTGPDTCKSAACGGPTLPCTDGNPCTIDTCTPAGGCTSTSGSGGCDDGNACTTGDMCVAGQCLGAGKLNCDDANPCTADSCDPSKGCLHANVAGPCNDGNACTTGDACAAGKCAGTAKSCDDGNVCTNDSCTPSTGACVHSANTAACSDGNNCTTEACAGGSCKATPKDCGDGVACTVDSCNPATGACLHESPKGFTKNFDDGLLSPVELSNPNPVFNWKLDTFQSKSPKTSLYFGLVNPINGQHTYGQPQLPLPITGTATLANQVIPVGVSNAQWASQLFFAKAAADVQNCSTDRVEFRVNGVMQAQVCAITPGFVPVTVNLSAFVGQTVTLSVVFIANGTANNGQGAWVDDLSVGWTCP